MHTMLAGYPQTSGMVADIKSLEHEGDRVMRSIVAELTGTFVTPFDREDIYQLATELDDVVDYVEEASDLLGLYGVESATRHAVEQCGIIVQAVEQLAVALGGLKGMRGVQDALVRVKALEDEGDRAVRDAVAALFRDDRIDPLIVIRWKDIYEALEQALDACETAANVIANIVVKNA
jgi:predicted phosphate transport protein (TIGR00153 family)